MAQVWDVHTGTPISSEIQLAGSAEWVELSRDGSNILTVHSVGLNSGIARVWSTHTGQPLSKPMMHSDVIRSAHFSPDGLWVITASSDGTVRIWEASTGMPVTLPWQHKGEAEVAEFSPDELTIVTGGSEQSYRFWDVSTPERHHSYAYLAEVMETVLGAQLQSNGTIIPYARALGSIIKDKDLNALFSSQLARWKADRSQLVTSGNIHPKSD